MIDSFITDGDATITREANEVIDRGTFKLVVFQVAIYSSPYLSTCHDTEGLSLLMSLYSLHAGCVCYVCAETERLR